MTGPVRLEPAHSAVAGALHAICFEVPWSPQEFAQLLAQPGVAGLLWTAGNPQGFIVIRAVADEAEILTLAVAPAVQRTGIATALIAEACRMLRAGGTRRLFLEVAADNDAACGLYDKCGFVRSGRRAGYYDRGRSRPRADAFIMSLDLGPMPPSAAPHH